MKRALFILPFKLCAKMFVYTETDNVIGTVTPFALWLTSEIRLVPFNSRIPVACVVKEFIVKNSKKLNF